MPNTPAPHAVNASELPSEYALGFGNTFRTLTEWRNATTALGNAMILSADAFPARHVELHSNYRFQYLAQLQGEHRVDACSECGEPTPTVFLDELSPYGNVCYDCRDQFYSYDDDSNEWSHAYEERGSDMPQGLQSYDSDAAEQLRFYRMNEEKSIKRPLFLGVEVEVEITGSNEDVVHNVGRAMNGHAILVSDGSLRCGFEIVSAPATLDYHRTKLWEKLYEDKALTGCSAWDQPSCGMHIHASKNALGGTASGNALVLGKILTFMNDPDNHAFIKAISGRSTNTYAQFLPNKPRPSQYYTNTGKYSVLNTSKPDTIEFRLWRGNTKKVGIFRNLEFVHSIIHFCRIARCMHREGATTPFLCVQDYCTWMAADEQRATYPHAAKHMQNLGWMPADLKTSRNCVTEDGDVFRIRTKRHTQRALRRAA